MPILMWHDVSPNLGLQTPGFWSQNSTNVNCSVGGFMPPSSLVSTLKNDSRSQVMLWQGGHVTLLKGVHSWEKKSAGSLHSTLRAKHFHGTFSILQSLHQCKAVGPHVAPFRTVGFLKNKWQKYLRQGHYTSETAQRPPFPPHQHGFFVERFLTNSEDPQISITFPVQPELLVLVSFQGFSDHPLGLLMLHAGSAHSWRKTDETVFAPTLFFIYSCKTKINLQLGGIQQKRQRTMSDLDVIHQWEQKGQISQTSNLLIDT